LSYQLASSIMHPERQGRTVRISHLHHRESIDGQTGAIPIVLLSFSF
jgi:hypothetical protein